MSSTLHTSNRYALPSGLSSAMLRDAPSDDSFSFGDGDGGGGEGAIASIPRVNGHAHGHAHGHASTSTSGMPAGMTVNRDTIPRIDNATPGPSTAPSATPVTAKTDTSAITNANTNANGTTSEKPERKRKKKGWKGWALVIEDEQGNVLEINDGPAPPPLVKRDKGRVGGSGVKLEETPVDNNGDANANGNSKSPSPYVDGVGDDPRDSGSPEPSTSRSKRARSSLKANGPSTRASPALAGAARENKKPRRNSYSTTPQPAPEGPSEQVPKTANPSAPRHSLPKTKLPRAAHNNPLAARQLQQQQQQQPPPSAAPRSHPPPATARQTPPARSTPPTRQSQTIRQPVPTRVQPAPNRQQAIRAEAQPNSGRATPVNDDLPAKVLRTSAADRLSPVSNDVRDEAAMLIAKAARHRETASNLPSSLPSPTNDNSSASSSRLPQPLSPPVITNGTYHDDEDEDEIVDDFDEAYEKVKEAYRRGIRPCNNPNAPQERSVPIFGMEDAEPPEWIAQQGSVMAIAPRRDLPAPRDDLDRAYQQGFEGLPVSLSDDSGGFVSNVRDNLRQIVYMYFPKAEPRRDAFLESIGRGLANLGWQLTDSREAALGTIPPLPGATE